MKHPRRILPLLAVLPLSVPLAALLATPCAAAEAPTGLPHAFDAGWHGQATCEVLYEDERVRVGRCEFPPGIGHEKHYHEPHFGYVLEGSTMQITDAQGTREVTTQSGTEWTTTARTVHEALNVGTTTARYLIVEPR